MPRLLLGFPYFLASLIENRFRAGSRQGGSRGVALPHIVFVLVEGKQAGDCRVIQGPIDSKPHLARPETSNQKGDLQQQKQKEECTAILLQPELRNIRSS